MLERFGEKTSQHKEAQRSYAAYILFHHAAQLSSNSFRLVEGLRLRPDAAVGPTTQSVQVVRIYHLMPLYSRQAGGVEGAVEPRCSWGTYAARNIGQAISDVKQGSTQEAERSYVACG
jgi:hypothetical protein